MHFVQAKGLLSKDNGMNIYRGCTHGCIYCDSRSLCYGFTHVFEDIEVKENAPDLLEQALRSKRKKCMIGTGSMCDPYLPAEGKLQLTRRCLELIDRYGFGAAVLTKSNRILRDMDLLKRINRNTKAVVQITLTTYDEALCRKIEPNVSTTRERYEALLRFRDAGIPTVVWLTPILPFINDTEENIRGILDMCVSAGVKGIVQWGMGVTLRTGNREYFYQALDRDFPGVKRRYVDTYGNAYGLQSPDQIKLMKILKEICEANGIMYDPEECFAYMRKMPEPYEQLSFL